MAGQLASLWYTAARVVVKLSQTRGTARANRCGGIKMMMMLNIAKDLSVRSLAQRIG